MSELKSVKDPGVHQSSAKSPSDKAKEHAKKFLQTVTDVAKKAAPLLPSPLASSVVMAADKDSRAFALGALKGATDFYPKAVGVLASQDVGGDPMAQALSASVMPDVAKEKAQISQQTQAAVVPAIDGAYHNLYEAAGVGDNPNTRAGEIAGSVGEVFIGGVGFIKGGLKVLPHLAKHCDDLAKATKPVAIQAGKVIDNLPDLKNIPSILHNTANKLADGLIELAQSPRLSVLDNLPFSRPPSSPPPSSPPPSAKLQPVLIDGGSLPASKITSPTDDLSSPIMKMQGGGGGQYAGSLKDLLNRIEAEYKRVIHRLEGIVEAAENASPSLRQSYNKDFDRVYDTLLSDLTEYMTRAEGIDDGTIIASSHDQLEISAHLQHAKISDRINALERRIFRAVEGRESTW
jgi:hypothetical protein